MGDAILLIFTVAALTFFLSMYHRLGGTLSLNHIWSLSPLSLTVPFPVHCIFASQLSSLMFYHLLETNKYGMLAASAHSHVLVQTRSPVPLAPPINPFHYHCVDLFPGHSPQLPLYYFSFQFPSYFFDFCVYLFVRICLAWSGNLWSVTGKSPISSYIFFILCLYFLFVGSLLIQHSITVLFTAFPTSFSILFDPLFDDNLLRPDQVPHGWGRNTFTASGSKSH